MDTTKYIKNLTLAYIVLLGLYLVSSFYFENQLPPLLQEYLAEVDTAGLSSVYTMVGLVLLPVLFIHFASLYGLLTVKSWAKSVFLYTNLVMTVALLFLGPVVNDAFSGMLDWLSSIAVGAILALLFLTPSAFSHVDHNNNRDTNG